MSDTEVGKDVSFTAGGETHHLWIDTAGSGVRVMVASHDPKPVPEKLNEWKAENDKKDANDPIKPKMNSVITLARSIHSTTLSDAVNAEKQMKDTVTHTTEKEKSEASISDNKVEGDEQNLARAMKDGFDVSEEGDSSKVEKLFKENKTNVHDSARDIIKASVDKLAKEKISPNIEWSGLVEKLKETDGTKELVEKPISNGTEYGQFTKHQVEDAAAKVLKDKTEDERKIKVNEAVKDIESKEKLHSYTSLRDQIFDKSKISISNERLLNLFSGGGEHSRYEPKNVIVTAQNNKIIVEYDYEVEVDGKKELRSFTSSMSLSEAEGNQIITQSTTGKNLVIKDPGRGHTDSVNQEKANNAIAENKQDKNTNIEFNAAHILADQFLGSGYRSALNLVTTSGIYNKEVMGGAEKTIRAKLEQQEKIEKKKNKDNYISFDITVAAEWKPVIDSKIVAQLRKTHIEMTKEESEAVLALLAADKDPKLVTKVDYKVDTIYIRGLNGDLISEKDSNITDRIGADETLNESLINKKL